jgi:cell division protein FtsW (lipid II flippase)
MISLRSDKGNLIALACTAAVVLFLVWVGLHWILGVILFVAFALIILLQEGAAPAPVSPVGFGPDPVPPDEVERREAERRLAELKLKPPA